MRQQGCDAPSRVLRWLRWSTPVTFLVALSVCIYVATLAYPISEATRVRNALVAERGSPTDFEWRPDQEPPGYKLERSPPHPELVAVLESLHLPREASALERAIAVALHLRSQPRRGNGIRSNTVDAYRRIVTRGEGYCADYAQVFNGLMHAAGIPVREWGFSFDHFTGNGHSVNAIWDDRLDQWVFIDVFNAFIVRDAATGRPLSGYELSLRLRAQSERLRIEPLRADLFGFSSEDEAVAYFRRGVDGWFLVWGNNVIAYDANPFVRAADSVSRGLEQTVALLIGILPEIRLVETARNGESIEELLRLGLRVKLLALVELALLALLGLELLLQRHRAGGPPPHSHRRTRLTALRR